jgi:hypothetical protein
MNANASLLEGGCACGAIRYRVAAEPLMMACCHCRDCQRQTGSAYFPAVAVPAAALHVTGRPRSYASKADSGNTVTRVFCGECGSTLWAWNSGMPDGRQLAAASLDDPTRFAPSLHVFAASAQPWDTIPVGALRFERMPGARG